MHVIQQLVIVIQADSKCSSHLFTGRIAPKLVFKAAQLFSQPFVLVSHRTTEYIIRTQLIQNCAAHVLFGKGFEKYTPRGVETVGCINQADHGCAQKVLLIEVLRQMDRHSAYQIVCQRDVVYDQLLANLVLASVRRNFDPFLTPVCYNSEICCHILLISLAVHHSPEKELDIALDTALALVLDHPACQRGKAGRGL